MLWFLTLLHNLPKKKQPQAFHSFQQCFPMNNVLQHSISVHHSTVSIRFSGNTQDLGTLQKNFHVCENCGKVNLKRKANYCKFTTVPKNVLKTQLINSACSTESSLRSSVWVKQTKKISNLETYILYSQNLYGGKK